MPVESAHGNVLWAEGIELELDPCRTPAPDAVDSALPAARPTRCSVATAATSYPQAGEWRGSTRAAGAPN
jgi:hypothetical protein